MGFRDDLVARAVAEWDWFGKDKGRADHFIAPDGKTSANSKTNGKPNPRKETVEPYSDRIADYWLSISSADYKRLVKKFAPNKGKLDGTVDLPWSAAFISYCMQIAGAGTKFPYAPGHATWMIASIKNKAANKLGASLVGFRVGEIPLKVGDLVGKTRTAGVTYDNAVAKGWFESHSDIVVDIDAANGIAHVIGGNVGQTVSKATVEVTSSGKLKTTGGWIVHIQNNIVTDPAIVAAAAISPSDAFVG